MGEALEGSHLVDKFCDLLDFKGLGVMDSSEDGWPIGVLPPGTMLDGDGMGAGSTGGAATAIGLGHG